MIDGKLQKLGLCHRDMKKGPKVPVMTDNQSSQEFYGMCTNNKNGFLTKVPLYPYENKDHDKKLERM